MGQGQYQTFIVRFWSDPAAADVLRGHIQHIASGHGLYFRDIERMIRFMDEHRGARGPISAETLVNNGAPRGPLAAPDRELAAKSEDVDVYET